MGNIDNILAELSGLKMYYETVGMRAFPLGICLLNLLSGDDTPDRIMRLENSIDVTPDSNSIKVMKEAWVGGPGHYLGPDQALRLMQTEYVCPKTGNRICPKEWSVVGRPALLDRAMARQNGIRAKAGGGIDPQIDAPLRVRLNMAFR
ncbi:trimethylamine methyltransferase family protein [Paracoccus sp. IB05]|uniref:trimethylamine methyltransferase family protein n=1 Tax=Paracoccus sp. IB05 TaxID=2779367 RepID=UPI001E5E0E82|nr:trimethylamine methyltransferase family protein [Paracoccus sp. IB05]